MCGWSLGLPIHCTFITRDTFCSRGGYVPELLEVDILGGWSGRLGEESLRTGHARSIALAFFRWGRTFFQDLSLKSWSGYTKSRQ